MKHLLVTNDFPPKVGGIQSYLWELWRRLPPEDVTVLTTAYAGSEAFDHAAPFRIERIDSTVMLPVPSLRDRIDAVAAAVDADLVLLDPALPLGHLGPSLQRPYGVVLHGAEVTVPGRLPGVRRALGRVLAGADLVVAAGGYPASEGQRVVADHRLQVIQVPPGVDTEKFVPLSAARRAEARARFGIGTESVAVVGVSRLVPRKGMDVVIAAAGRLEATHPDLEVVLGGSGRDRRRLQRHADRSPASVRLLGRVPEADLPDLYGCADVFAIPCRNRWLGLEQEGFGIVFLEAAACGVAQIAGDSGGAAEAVVDGETGLVVHDPGSADEVMSALRLLVDNPGLRAEMGTLGRKRAVDEFSYDVLTERLRDGLDAWVAP